MCLISDNKNSYDISHIIWLISNGTYQSRTVETVILMSKTRFTEKMIDRKDFCFRWTSQRVLSWEPWLKQGFWVVRRKEWFIIYKNVQLFLQFWNSEIASRQKMNPFRVISSSLAPRYFLHRLRELLSSSAFLFDDCSHWLLVSANQHWSTWQSRQKKLDQTCSVKFITRKSNSF